MGCKKTDSGQGCETQALAEGCHHKQQWLRLIWQQHHGVEGGEHHHWFLGGSFKALRAAVATTTSCRGSKPDLAKEGGFLISLCSFLMRNLLQTLSFAEHRCTASVRLRLGRGNETYATGRALPGVQDIQGLLAAPLQDERPHEKHKRLGVKLLSDPLVLAVARLSMQAWL